MTDVIYALWPVTMSEIYLTFEGEHMLRSEFLGRKISYFLLKSLAEGDQLKDFEMLQQAIAMAAENDLLAYLDGLRMLHAIDVIFREPVRRYYATKDGRRWFSYLQALNTPRIAGYIELKIGLEQIRSAFLREIEEKPERFRKIYVCSPFLTDPTFLNEIVSLVHPDRIAQTLFFVTRPARNVQYEKDKHEAFIKELEANRIPHRQVPNLHAKVFLGMSFDLRESFALISSLNITAKPLLDIGVLVRGELEEIREFINSLEESIKRL